MANEAIKAARALAKLAKWTAEQQGVAAPVFDQKELVAAIKEEKSTRPKATSMDAEAVLIVLLQPAAFTYKVCKREECKEPFGTNYHACGYCSDNCRAKDLAKSGIAWDPTKRPEDRWKGEPPLVIPSAAVKVLRQLLATLPDDEHLPPDALPPSPSLPTLEFEIGGDEIPPAPLSDQPQMSLPEPRPAQSAGLVFEASDVFDF